MLEELWFPVLQELIKHLHLVLDSDWRRKNSLIGAGATKPLFTRTPLFMFFFSSLLVLNIFIILYASTVTRDPWAHKTYS